MTDPTSQGARANAPSAPSAPASGSPAPGSHAGSQAPGSHTSGARSGDDEHRSGPPVAVIGAGIAGLTAALALAAKGFAVDVIERAASLDEVGAGLQLSPNATRILDALGLTERLRPHWVEPSEIRLVDGRSLRTLARVPAGAAARERWKAPYAVIPRAALQLTLADAVRAHPACRLHLDTEIREATPLSIIGITGLHPLLIIGADGIRSKVRLALNGHGQAQQSGNVAWRLRLPPHASGLTGSHPLSGPNPGFDGSGPFDASLVTACLGRKAHLIAYPLGAGGGLNLVVVGSGFGQDGSTLQTGDRDVHKAVSTLLAGWHPHIRATLDRAETLGRWPLVEVADGAWHDGTRILIGDAAHAMMPFAAQGAAMAIEDAYELADALPATEDAARLVPALDRFVMHRKARVARVRSRGAFNRFAYHASGPVRLGRDLVLSLRTPEALSGDFDWLYGYRSPGLPA